MVLYSNINLNQRVELIYDNQLLRGTVKYKGAVNNLDGEWIGVSLDMPYGQHNGLYKGRRYFEAKQNHGVFVRAGKLRFIQNTRRSIFNKYYRRSHGTSVQEELFGVGTRLGDETNPADAAYRSNDLFDTLGSRFRPSGGGGGYPAFGLTGSVSRQIPAATMRRPMTAAAAYTYTSSPVQSQHRLDKEAWEPVASIPKSHMPHSAQLKQTKRGWESAHWTRELSVPTARQHMKSAVWNDVSF